MDAAINRFQKVLKQEVDLVKDAIEDEVDRRVREAMAGVNQRAREIDERESGVNQRARELDERDYRMQSMQQDFEERMRNLEDQENAMSKLQGEASAGYSRGSPTAATSAAAGSSSTSLFGSGTATSATTAPNAPPQPKAAVIAMGKQRFSAGVDPMSDDDEGPAGHSPDARCSLDRDDWRQHARQAVGQASTNAGDLKDKFSEPVAFQEV